VISILVVTNMYPPHHLGGYELSCRDVVLRWRARGHLVGVLTTTLQIPGVPAGAGAGDVPHDAEQAVRPAASEPVRRELRFYWDDHELVSPPPWRRLAIERHNQRRLGAALDRIRPDVVSVWNMGAMSLGLLTTVAARGIPMVLNVCDDWLVYGPRLDAWTRLFSDRPRLARATRALARVPTGPPDLDRVGPACFVSAFTRDRARAWSRWDVPCSTVVFSGIEPREFPVTAPVEREGWDWRLLYVGRLDERKGLETLLAAMPRLPSAASLDVLGRGPESYLTRLRARAAELGVADRVRFAVADRAALHEWYRAADAFVFPSEWDEPFGLVPVEAMACGTPVVATGTGGSAEFLADGVNCLLYPPGDAGGLVQALDRLAADPPLRARLRRGGLATATELSVDRLAEVLEQWHVGAARGFPDGAPPARRLPLTRGPGLPGTPAVDQRRHGLEEQ
jgi:glycogen(starch) synthase